MHRKPGQEKAAQFIRQCIEKEVFEPGEPIPGVTRLSCMAGVSKNSMWKAERTLKQEGILGGTKGTTYVIGARVQPDDEHETAGSGLKDTPLLWQRIKHELEKRILGHYYQADTPFPSVKDLQRDFTVSYSTIRKALHALCREGKLVPSKRGYRVPLNRYQRSIARIVLIGRADFEGSILGTGELDVLFWRSFEEQCTKTGVRMEIFRIGGDPNTSIASKGLHAHHYLAALQDTDATLGYLYVVNSLQCLDDEVFRKLSRFRKPVAVLDEEGGWDIEKYVGKNPFFRVFIHTLSRKSGRAVGQYLLGLGHRNIAYVSTHHRNVWSLRRYEGLASMYSDAGIPQGVVPFLFDNDLPPRVDGIHEIPRLDLNARLQPLIDSCERIRDIEPLVFSRQLNQLAAAIRGDLSALSQRALYARPILQRLALDKSITAWVFVNDFAAIAALEFCAQHDIAVPRRVSVVGFDDCLGAMRYRLTSYNFNIPGTVNAMLNYVMNTPIWKIAHHKRVIEIEGFLVERKTTAKIR